MIQYLSLMQTLSCSVRVASGLVLDEGEGDRDAAHQAHGEQITLGVVAVHGGADAGEDHREENGDDAGAYIAGDLSGGGQVLALLDIAGGESGRQLLGHVPHGERHAVVEHIGEADPCGLSSGAGEGHPEQQHHAEHHQRNGHDQPGPDLTLPADRGVDDLGHDNVGHRVEQLREQREEDHKAGHPHRPLRREAEHVRHVLVVIAVDDGLYDQHPVGADHIAQPHFLGCHIGRGNAGVPSVAPKRIAKQAAFCFYRCAHSIASLKNC